MVDITVLELHLHDADFTANAPFSSDDGGDEERTDAERAGADGGVGLVGLVVALCVLGLLALGLKRLLSGRADGADHP